jgi:tight adherence protein B
MGILLITWAWLIPGKPRPPSVGFVERALVEAGMPDVPTHRFVAVCVSAFAVTWVLAVGISQSVVIASFLGLIGGLAPWALLRYQQRRRKEQLHQVWPDAIEHLASGIRAGLSLPEALIQLADSGPIPLQSAFAEFATDYRASGNFTKSIERLKANLADPVGDRVMESLRLARDVGGNDLGKLLRALARFLRDDLRTRGELESRQSWTVNAARLAVAAPWVLLVLLSLRPEAVAAYDSTAGMVVLTFGAVVSLVAYRLMLRLGRLPEERRVLQ